MQSGRDGNLAEAQRLTISESLSTVRLHLWDETERKLMSFAEARAIWPGLMTLRASMCRSSS